MIGSYVGAVNKHYDLHFERAFNKFNDMSI